MGAYVLDAMRYKEGAFMASWLSMAAANLAMVYSLLALRTEWPLTLALLIFLLNGVTLFLTGERAHSGRACRGQQSVHTGQAVALRPQSSRLPPTTPLRTPPTHCTHNTHCTHTHTPQASGPRCSSSSFSCSTLQS